MVIQFVSASLCNQLIAALLLCLSRGAECCDKHVSLSMSRYMTVSQEPHVQTSSNFICVLSIVMAQSSSGGVVIHMILWMALYFPVVDPMVVRCNVVYNQTPLLHVIGCILSWHQG